MITRLMAGAFLTVLAVGGVVPTALATQEPAAAATAVDTRPVRAIVGGTLIDGTGRPPRRNVAILIKDGRIEGVVDAAQAKLAPSDRVIRAEGKFILPGLFDAHIHYREYYPELLVSHGITSIAEWGNSPIPWLMAQRDGVTSGHLMGPRMFTSGAPYPEAPEEQTPEKAAAWLRRMLALGVDKIDIGFGSTPEVLKVLIEGGHKAGLPVSGFPAYANEAIDLGMDGLKHTYAVGIASQTDPAKISEIQTQARMSYRKRDLEMPLVGPDPSALAKRLALHKVSWIPTMVKDFKVFTDRRDEFEFDAMRLLSDPNLDYLPRGDLFMMTTSQFGMGIPTPGGMHFAGLVDRRFDKLDFDSPAFKKYREGYRNLQALIRLTVASGGRVLAGTAPHSYVLPGLALHQELQLFVDAGLTPMQALQSASLWVAEYLRKEKDLGSVEVGKLADIIVLDKDPLADIRNSRTVRYVVQGGRALPVGYHFSYRNPIPLSTIGTSPGAGSPQPVVKSLSDPSVARGGGPLQLRVGGDLFMPGAVVYIGDSALDTRFDSLTELTAVVPARLRAEVGTYWVTVVNPPPGRSTSSPAPFIVKY